jgi:hypothetical protein
MGTLHKFMFMDHLMQKTKQQAIYTVVVLKSNFTYYLFSLLIGALSVIRYPKCKLTSKSYPVLAYPDIFN